MAQVMLLFIDCHVIYIFETLVEWLASSAKFSTCIVDCYVH